MTVSPLRRALTILAVTTLTVAAAPAAAAAEPDPKALTWTVQPATPSGPDQRRWINASLDPGEARTEHLAVRNFSRNAVAFSLKAADGYLTDKGRFNMLSSDRTSVDGGTWIDVQERVTVGPNETKVVPFTITVPKGATPGDHPAGIAATVTSTGGTVNVESRVGFRVMVRVNGTAQAALPVNGLSATYAPSWNPFAGGTVRVRYTVQNDGNVWVSGTGRVSVSDLFGRTSHDVTSAVEEMLPGGSREVETRADGVWALGRLRTTVTTSPALLGDGQAGADLRPASATVTTWVVPWAQLALLCLLAALIVGLRVATRRRRRRLAGLLARAREEGRQEVQESALVGSASSRGEPDPGDAGR
ncbi:WxL protein peptidoglycan domain-containing protein [Micromonospora sp. CA-259024]|uniref:WxL protein peptidoglycan domain-containing protein n=1 Tax=Micromonospora sp. CA-259024 TaxID=3239965 RepID=UPI003D8D8682